MRYWILPIAIILFSFSVFAVSDYSGGDYTEEELENYVLSDSDTLNKTLLYLKKRYLNPNKIDPKEMFKASLSYIERSIPEIIIKQSDNAQRVEVLLESKRKRFTFKPVETVWQLSINLRRIFQFIEKNIDKKKTLKNVELSSIEGMLSTLDPHTSLLRPSLYTEMKMSNAGSFGGLGIVISMRDGKLTVVSPIEDTPAFYAGIKSKDVIVRINDESTVGMDLSQAVDRMRGEPGTKLTIWIMRKGWVKAKPFKLTRAIIKMKSVSSKLLKDGVGYIKIKSFQGNTATDLLEHMKKLQEKTDGKLKGLVLDLRNDPGGLLDQAIRVSDIFLKEGYIVSTVGLGNSYRDDKKAMDDGDEPKYPIIVLTNSGSASASEIVSGAIKMNKRGLIMGQRTFGKGSVQTLLEFDDRSALKMTIAQYLIYYNISIQNVGINPDILVTPVMLSKDEISYYDSKNEYHESDYSNTNVFENDNQQLKDKPRYSFRYLYEDKRTEKEKKDEEFYKDDLKYKDDFEIEIARKLILKGKSADADKFFKEIKPFLDKMEKKNDKIISNKLKNFNVVWEKGENPEKVNIDVKFSIEKSVAGEKLKVKATVKNLGDKTLYRLRATSDSETYFLRSNEFLFGKLKPKSSRIWISEIPIPKNADTQKTDLVLKFYLGDKDLKKEFTTFVDIKELPKPEYSVSYKIKEGKKDNKLTVGESITLDIDIKNIGKGEGLETAITLKNKTSKEIFIDKGRTVIKKMPTGKNFKNEFKFTIKEGFNKDKVELDLIIFDTELKIFKKFDLILPVAIKKKQHNFKGADILFSKTVPTFVKKGKDQKITFSGTVKGNIMDYYIYNSNFKNLKFNYDKLFFKNNPKKLKKDNFSFPLTLKPGLNRITVVVRSSETLVTTKDILIYNENKNENKK